MTRRRRGTAPQCCQRFLPTAACNACVNLSGLAYMHISPSLLYVTTTITIACNIFNIFVTVKLRYATIACTACVYVQAAVLLPNSGTGKQAHFHDQSLSCYPVKDHADDLCPDMCTWTTHMTQPHAAKPQPPAGRVRPVPDSPHKVCCAQCSLAQALTT